MAHVAVFDYPICYEDRNSVHTSRWKLIGLDTRSAGNSDLGWLYVTSVDTANSVAVTIYKDSAGSNSVMMGTGDISGIDDDAVLVTLSEANSSGLSGEFYFESYSSDMTLNRLKVSLCVDADIAEEWQDLDDLPSDVYSSTQGMAIYCAAATRRTLLRVSQMYTEQLGGFGAPEDRRFDDATRSYPDFRRLISPDQLKETAVYWALELAMGSKHERHEDTMYSELRDYYAEKRAESMSAWNLTFNTNPSTDSDADTSKGIAMVQPTRL